MIDTQINHLLILQPRPPHFQLGYGLQVNLVRPVRQPQRPRTREHPRQRSVVAHAQRTVDLNRRVDHRDGGSRRRDYTNKKTMSVELHVRELK